MTQPSLQRVWMNVSPQLATDAAAFWVSHQALDVTGAWERTRELTVVARDDSGAICAVSTARAQAHPQLGLALFYFRMFIAPRRRSQALARDLLAESVRTLALDARIEHPDGPKGVWLELHNARIDLALRDLVWRVREFDFVYLGRSAQGFASRVCFFPGARLPPPAIPLGG